MPLDETSEPQATASSPEAAEGSIDVRGPEERGAQSPFPIVGIGASAGGLEAFTQLLTHLPDRTGMAFVLVQHLDPRHESRLSDLLGRATRMPVVEASQGREVEPNHVYIIPSNTNMTITQGALRLTPRGEAYGPHLPVDHFLGSLAEAQQSQAIGVVLSGTGSDGTFGLSEIKAVGGISFAQEPESAKHGGMPRNAIDSGVVDFVSTPEGIAKRLATIDIHPYLAPGPAETPAQSEDQLTRVLATVRAQTGMDFSFYRDPTIRRRIMRRMAVHGQQALADYAERLEQDSAEVEALYRDLLINVTSFFRDPALFEALKSSVFPEIMKAKTLTTPLRLWVPGCSTGQEAYSLAIALWEFFDRQPVRPPIQIFATDLSDVHALDRARAGLYPESIEAEVSPERLRRFFKRENHLYRIDKSIRDVCVFARQNLTTDPPFSRVDLISCRNVLIYMTPALQKRVLPVFHYALNVPGSLVLGSSETMGEFTELFEAVDRTHKIYGKKLTGSRPPLHFSIEGYKELRGANPRTAPVRATLADFHKEADRLLLGRYAPPGVLVNEHYDILQFRGRTGPYLEAPAGEPTVNLLKMARQGLFLELRSALNEASKGTETIAREGVWVRDEGSVRELTIQVLPVQPRGGATSCYLVLFEEGPHPEGVRGMPASALALHEPEETPAPERENSKLHQELAAMREYLQSLIEQQDAANEELRSANEEILSSNEELQSTNEELQTAKEELQSANEELSTVNEQLQHRNLELNQTSNDLINLLTSITIPVLMVGLDLRIRRLTPPARKIMNLLPSDIGRPIGDLKANVDVPDLEMLIGEVIEEVQVREREVCNREGRWYSLRIRPYRTTDNKIEGAVVLLLDIDEIKRTEEALRESEERLSLAVHGTGMATWDMDLKSGKRRWSETHFRLLGYDPLPGGEATEEMWQSRIHPEDRERVLRALEEARRERSLYAPEYRILRADNGEERWLKDFGRFSYDEGGEAARFVGVMCDVTDNREAEQLSYQATHDALTGLINRGEFERRLQRVLGTAEPQDPHALLYLDLDQFKLVNDTAGHRAGDELLRQLAAVLEAHTRKRDTLARLGGDEFGVLLEHCAPEQALRIARGLVQAVQEFQFVWEAKRFTIGASLGLVSIPEGGGTLADVMSAADRACYAAKDKGRNRVHVYAASDEELARRAGEMRWIPRLHQALAQNRFRLYAQPVVALGDHAAEGEYQEVLLRLADEQEGLLLPGAFIPAAERYQQMQALDRWVVQTTLAGPAAHGESVRYGINVSGQSLGDEAFLDYVTEHLERSGVAPAKVCFEITETAAITDLKRALQFMNALKGRGCRFALDDFGSGLSSFGYLKSLPVDYLKIDGRFVKDITQDPLDEALVQAIQQIAKVLRIKTIAESAETDAILERLRAIGVDYAQGYAIARPEPLEIASTLKSSS